MTFPHVSWTSPPAVLPDPSSPGTYLLRDGTRISTTFRSIIEEVHPPFSHIRCVPLVRRAALHYLRSISQPGHEHRTPWVPEHPRYSYVQPFLRQLLQPHHWAHLEILCAPLTLHLTRPLAAGSIDALVRHRLSNEVALLCIETTPRTLARNASSAVLAHLGAHVAAAIDTFHATIDHVMMVWVTSDAPPQFELLSPDRCLDCWITAVDLRRWMAHHRLLPHQQCPSPTSTPSPAEASSSPSLPPIEQG